MEKNYILVTYKLKKTLRRARIGKNNGAEKALVTFQNSHSY